MIYVNKAKISNYDGKSKSFYVQFNPNTISISEYVSEFAKKKVKQPDNHKKNIQMNPADNQLAVSENTRGITFETKLFFNTYESELTFSDVRELIRNFDPFLNKHAQKEAALQKIRFSWGAIDIFGLLTSMNVTYTMFAHTGDPVRAEAAITIVGDYVKAEKPQYTREMQNSESIRIGETVEITAALASYGSMDTLKKAARLDGVVNLRTLT